DLVVHLASTNPTVAAVPETLTIPAGYSTTYYRVTGLAPGTVQISGSAVGWTGSATTITVVAPSLEFRGVATSRTTESAPNPIYIVPISGSCGWCDAFNADVAITLSVSGTPTGIVSVPATRSEEHTSELQSLRHLVCRL